MDVIILAVFRAAMCSEGGVHRDGPPPREVRRARAAGAPRRHRARGQRALPDHREEVQSHRRRVPHRLPAGLHRGQERHPPGPRRQNHHALLQMRALSRYTEIQSHSVGTEESVRHGKCSTGKVVDNVGISGAVRLGLVGQLSCRSLSVSITFLHLLKTTF